MTNIPCWFVLLLNRITEPALKQKLPVRDYEHKHAICDRSVSLIGIAVAKFFAVGKVGIYVQA